MEPDSRYTVRLERWIKWDRIDREPNYWVNTNYQNNVLYSKVCLKPSFLTLISEQYL